MSGASSEEPNSGPTSCFSKMVEDQSPVPEQIWSLTLEIVCLLTDECFPAMSSDHVTMAVSPPSSWTLESLTMEKILEISNRITELLMEKTGIKEELVEKASGQTEVVIIKMEPFSCPASPERPSLDEYEYGDGSAVEEMGVRSDEQSIDEEISPFFGEGYLDTRRPNLMHPEMPTDYKTEDDTVERIFYGENNFQQLQLLRHNSVSAVKKTFYCSECGKYFLYKSKLISHERVHTGEKPFSCTECGKCFSQKAELLKHERIHTGEKPFSCSECGKCFSLKSHLGRHERVHTGVKPYSCTECGKCFYQRADLVKHERVHTGVKPYACTQCWKCFSQKADLVKHERVHTGEKPYSCKECGKCFTQKSAVVLHQKIHTGMKPYSCSVCGKSLPRKSDLDKHKKIHTGEKT